MSDCCSSAPAKAPCCCGSTKPSSTPTSSALTFRERWGDLFCRFSNRVRMNYRVAPGLYSLGKPSPESPVLVSANYRMSFNRLRSAMKGRDAWILVLDTKGINVWCAAGKGTFGTLELVHRIADAKLASVVSHRRLIVPQLGASGVFAHQVTKETGFAINYGPVRAEDLPAYLEAGNTATAEMRRVHFRIADRLALIPTEVIPAMKHLAFFCVVATVLFGATRTGILYRQALDGAVPLIIAGLTAVLTGSVLTPALLPLLPGRSFAVKGFLAGCAGITGFFAVAPIRHDDYLLIALCAVAIPAWSSYMALLFTGCATYTSPSGVKAELKVALPVYIGAAGVSFGLLTMHLLRHWGIV